MSRLQALSTLLAAVLVATVTVAPPARAGSADQLVWADHAATRIYISNTWDAGTRTLIDLPPMSGDFPAWPEAVWSPDGKKIAVLFQSGSRCCEIVVIDIASGARVRVATDAHAAEPSFSPDGRSLVYANTRGDLTIVAADGSARRTLALPDELFANFAVRWSPDGSRIAFLHSYFEELADLYVIRTDGSGLAAITKGEEGARRASNPEDFSAGSAGSFSWEPNGKRLVYSRRTGSSSPPYWQLWLSSATGGTQVRLTGGTRDGHYSPQWSPRGDLIAFTDGWDIFTVEPDGTGRTRVADVPDSLDPGELSWGPDQDQIAFTGWHRTNNYDTSDVYVANVPGAVPPPERISRTDAGYLGGFSPIPSRPAAEGRTIEDACPPGEVPEDGFTDVPQSHPHEPMIDCAVWWELTSGVGNNRYAPGNGVTRGQMATFIANLVRAGGGRLAEDPPDRFTDDEGSPHEVNINRLAEAGIANGTSASTFSPNTYVSRAQMASFLIAAYRYLTGREYNDSQDYFYDDHGLVHEENINRAAREGFATGVEHGRYAPGATVTRGQMATFLVRVLDLLVEQGRVSTPS